MAATVAVPLESLSQCVAILLALLEVWTTATRSLGADELDAVFAMCACMHNSSPGFLFVGRRRTTCHQTNARVASSVAYVFSPHKIVVSSQSCLVLQSTIVIRSPESLANSFRPTGSLPTPPVSFCAGEEHRRGLRNILAFPGALK